MTDDRTDWSRIVFVGTSCSAKTTLARTLASRLGVPHVELDGLYWLPAGRIHYYKIVVIFHI
jgi:ATP-dependent protease Clp ATPase subunit